MPLLSSDVLSADGNTTAIDISARTLTRNYGFDQFMVITTGAFGGGKLYIQVQDSLGNWSYLRDQTGNEDPELTLASSASSFRAQGKALRAILASSITPSLTVEVWG